VRRVVGRRAEDHPKVYTEIDVEFVVEGKGWDGPSDPDDAGNHFKIRLRDIRQRYQRIRKRSRSFRETLQRLYHREPILKQFDALKGVSLTVAPGETLGLIGRNGSGKSTLLKIIARIFSPTAGTVEVNGAVSPLIELGAGFHLDLTGRENVVLAGVILGFTRREMERKLDPILDFAGLQDFIDTPLRTYSSGMAARLGFAVATEIDPDILLVDEVLAVGDVGFQEKCLARMNSFRRLGKTMVFVSHDMDQVREVCDRVALLHEGELLAEGKPEGVISRYLGLLRELGPNRPLRQRIR